MNNETTIKELFSNEKIRFEIPSYQRAYSWESEQIQQFIDDLKNVRRHYYFGNFLFEGKKEDEENTLLVIDGQQRLTTTVIFFSAVFKRLAELQKEKGNDDTEERLSHIQNTYLAKTGFRQHRFSTVKADRDFFNDVISKQAEDSFHEVDTASRKRIVNAKRILDKAVSDKSEIEIAVWVETLEKADITTYKVPNKKRATQIFSFQNDRGKGLSLLEKIKSYFMLQVYLEFEDEKDAANVIEFIENNFSKIYTNTEETGLKEVEALRAFWRTFGGRGLKIGKVLSEIKKDLDKAPNKIEWIEKKMLELTRTFEILKLLKYSQKVNPIIKDLYSLNNLSFLLPFLIRAKIRNFSEKDFNRLARTFEILTFRHLLGGGRTKISDRLHEQLKRMIELEKTNNAPQIITEIISHAKTHGWWWKWSDHNLKTKLNEDFYGNRADNYLLWKYEQNLSRGGYNSIVSYKSVIASENIEHIAPRKHKGDDPLTQDYGIYHNEEHPEQGIISGNWLNKLGNLMLLSESHNKGIGNNSFTDKLKTYLEPATLQQQKILHQYFTDRSTPLWDVEAIKNRHKDLVEFTLKEWNFDNI